MITNVSFDLSRVLWKRIFDRTFCYLLSSFMRDKRYRPQHSISVLLLRNVGAFSTAVFSLQFSHSGFSKAYRNE